MKKALRIFIYVLCLALVLPISQAKASGAERIPVKVYLDGVQLDLAGRSFAVNGTAYVPIRELSEAMGAEVVWSQADTTAYIIKEGLSLNAKMDGVYLEANGRYLYTPDGIHAQDGYLFVPVRQLAKAFGAEVTWNQEMKSVHIKSGGTAITPGEKFYSESDLYWLSRIIFAEAGAESLEGQIAVGNVVLNRIASDYFPNTIKSVIFDKKYGVQFTPAYSGAIYREPGSISVIAAKLVLDGASIAENSLYFASTAVAETCWAGRNRDFVMQIGSQIFYA